MNAPPPTSNKSLSSPENARLRQALSEHFGGVDVRLEGPISVRDYSEIFHAFIATPARLQAAVKRCLVAPTGAPDAADAVAQYRALQRVHCAIQDRTDRYRSPAPICLMPELATFAMNWIDGESLTRKMHRLAIFSDGPRWFEDIGAWLGNFHAAGPVSRVGVSLDDRLNHIEKLHQSHMDNVIFTQAVQLLKKYAAELESKQVNSSWLHGDCKSDNFMLFGEYVYGIDISLSFENPVEYDLAQFLNNLELILSEPHYPHLRWLRSRLEGAFWLGYQQSGPSVSEAYLQWLRLNFSLSMWHDHLAEQKRNARTWLRNRMLEELVNRRSKTLASIVN